MLSYAVLVLFISKKAIVFTCVCLTVTDHILMKFHGTVGRDPGTSRLDFE